MPGDGKPVDTAKATATIELGPEARTATEVLFGRALSDRELQELLGAPSGAHVMVDALRSGVLSFHVTHALYEQPQRGYILTHPNGNRFIQLELYHLRKSAPAGMGARFWSQMIDKARELGLQAIYIPHAARTSQMIGYYVWPRFGADAKIPIDKQRELPEELRAAERLSDLMKTAHGRLWWKANGTSIACTFDLNPESISSRLWKAYKGEHNL